MSKHELQLSFLLKIKQNEKDIDQLRPASGGILQLRTNH